MFSFSSYVFQVIVKSSDDFSLLCSYYTVSFATCIRALA